MIMDEKLEFCDAQNVNAAAGTALVGDVVDLGASPRLTNGLAQLVISVSTAFTSGGSATVQFRLCSDAQAAIAVDGSETVHWMSDIFPIAQLTVGKTLIVPLPGGNYPPYERYLGIEVVTATATTTAGAINAFITATPDEWAALADAIN